MAKVVLIHDWLTGMRGGEKCLEAACRLWPDSPLFTLLHRPGSVSATIERHHPRTSWLGKLPGVSRYYRALLPLMPQAARWPIPPCDLVLSFSHCMAKAAITPEGVPHLCYCFSPMRYAWQLRDAYVQGWRGRLVGPILDRLKNWDRLTANRVTRYIAISRTIRERIRECYDRDSDIIYPPVDTIFYTPSNTPRDEHYLIVSALVPYKRFDLAIEACTKLGRKLIVIGQGPEEARLRALAGSGVEFLGWQSDAVIREHYRRARALLFPPYEDFGIVPVEAQACGCPVIAYGAGGSRETVRSGLFFQEQTTESLIDAIQRFEKSEDTFDPALARRHALQFSTARFERELSAAVESLVGQAAGRIAA